MSNLTLEAKQSKAKRQIAPKKIEKLFETRSFETFLKRNCKIEKRKNESFVSWEWDRRWIQRRTTNTEENGNLSSVFPFSQYLLTPLIDSYFFAPISCYAALCTDYSFQIKLRDCSFSVFDQVSNVFFSLITYYAWEPFLATFFLLFICFSVKVYLRRKRVAKNIDNTSDFGTNKWHIFTMGVNICDNGFE